MKAPTRRPRGTGKVSARVDDWRCARPPAGHCSATTTASVIPHSYVRQKKSLYFTTFLSYASNMKSICHRNDDLLLESPSGNTACLKGTGKMVARLGLPAVCILLFIPAVPLLLVDVEAEKGLVPVGGVFSSNKTKCGLQETVKEQ